MGIMNSKEKRIELQIRKMENKKLQLIRLLNSLKSEKYNQQPDPKSWSAGQVANHLYLSEKLSLAYLRKKMSYPDTIPPFHIKSWGGILLYKLVFASGIKFKAPKQISMWEIQEVLPADQLDRKWNELRVELFGFLREKYPQFRNRLVYNHPFAGRMTMNQMLIFLNDHIRHHTKQVRRILKKIN